MVFQDRGSSVNEKAQFRTTIVIDTLTHKKEMPVTVGIFLNPGVVPAAKTDARPHKNRSFEYDSLSEQYARFLLEEILPDLLQETDNGCIIKGSQQLQPGLVSWRPETR